MAHMWRCIIVRIKQSTTRDEPQKARRKAATVLTNVLTGALAQLAAGQTWFAGIFYIQANIRVFNWARTLSLSLLWKFGDTTQRFLASGRQEWKLN